MDRLPQPNQPRQIDFRERAAVVSPVAGIIQEELRRLPKHLLITDAEQVKASKAELERLFDGLQNIEPAAQAEALAKLRSLDQVRYAESASLTQAVDALQHEQQYLDVQAEIQALDRDLQANLSNYGRQALLSARASAVTRFQELQSKILSKQRALIESERRGREIRTQIQILETAIRAQETAPMTDAQVERFLQYAREYLAEKQRIIINYRPLGAPVIPNSPQPISPLANRLPAIYDLMGRIDQATATLHAKKPDSTFARQLVPWLRANVFVQFADIRR